jgi:very-short-patch-repair endonuclease
VDLNAWQMGTGNTLSGLIRRNLIALEKPDWLSNWLDYVRVRHHASAIGLERLTAALEQGILKADEIDSGYKLAVFDVLAREILREVPALALFSGNAQLTLQKQFRFYDEKLKHLQRERIAWRIAQNQPPAGSVGGKVGNYTDLALLQHECTKTKRHIPLRQLVQRAGNALVALKPCFMMGPMSVAQYLAPGQIEFDIIVMDEASQMKPEDALGAIARGKQLVVVGDPKQLPPTSFFDKLIDDDEEDATAIEESESILDAAMPIFDRRRLRWHYRSQHESLIAFSNHSFYEDELVIFPSPHSESEDFGVKFIRISSGRFVKRRNADEARTIALAVQHHVLERPEESLGVVAMSADQRDQIECAVEALAKEDPLFREAMERNTLKEEPFFIKNLENVQGDERDVIFISCTYGPEDIGGKVYQRFGPINSDVGWRRLNVLFTRSKKRMHVFSSMGSEDILLSEHSKRGVIAFKNFLAFAETGHLHQAISTGKAPDSDFEVAVASALHQAGFECEPQVGVAGFFIDLAVCDPGNPGRYLMGIECDGATYHSAKSVRDRDRLRQTILERLGWRIRRIWSTDWFRSPRAEIAPIIRELNALKTIR